MFRANTEGMYRRDAAPTPHLRQYATLLLLPLLTGCLLTTSRTTPAGLSASPQWVCIKETATSCKNTVCVPDPEPGQFLLDFAAKKYEDCGTTCDPGCLDLSLRTTANDGNTTITIDNGTMMVVIENSGQRFAALQVDKTSTYTMAGRCAPLTR